MIAVRPIDPPPPDVSSGRHIWAEAAALICAHPCGTWVELVGIPETGARPSSLVIACRRRGVTIAVRCQATRWLVLRGRSREMGLCATTGRPKLQTPAPNPPRLGGLSPDAERVLRAIRAGSKIPYRSTPVHRELLRAKRATLDGHGCMAAS